MRLPVACLPLLILALARGAIAAESELLARVERAAATLPWLSSGDALFDRDPLSGTERERVIEVLRQLRGASDTNPATLQRATSPVEELRALLGHRDPKVRTLGILLLYDLNRSDVLPDIARLVNDDAETFPEPVRVSRPLMSGRQEAWPMRPVKVSQWARGAIDRWVSASWELSDARSRGQLNYDQPEVVIGRLRAFNRSRDPQTSTAALRVALMRATGGISPPRPERVARVEQVMSKLLQVPMPRRLFVAIALDFERYRGERYSTTFLLDMARQVPREVRLATIRRQRAIDDDDLKPGFGYWYFLDHAVDLFQASDVELILSSQPTRSASDSTDARYAVAAAMLEPQRADETLIAAMERFGGRFELDQRTRVATALADLGTEEKGLPAAIDWFFRESPQSDSFGFGRDKFLAELHARDRIRYREVLALIVRDERLGTLGPESTRVLLLTVEGYLGRRLADDDEIRASRGIDEAQSNQRFEHLAKWHRLLKETVDQWDH
jgi:hypothetical protein